MSVGPDEFQKMIEALIPRGVRNVAVGVSGGADSVALAACLARWAAECGVGVHVLSVDHALRAEAADEVAHASGLAQDLGVRFQALKWQHDGVSGRVQEAARAARYDLMAVYCREHDIEHLCLGHHMDDQAETVLFRLCKGSGLDGLGGMRSVQALDNGLTLVRPFLNVEKKALIEFCAAQDLGFVDDPSNEDTHYARVRLREAREVLEGEGLSARRLSVTARRLARARDALDEVAGRLYEQAEIKNETKHIVLNFKLLCAAPEEIALRCVLRAIDRFRVNADYQPRFEKVEALFGDLMADAPFRKRTLGGVIFERDDMLGHVILSDEARF
jgi:tRNA(Ile)-lysidine synthase